MILTRHLTPILIVLALTNTACRSLPPVVWPELAKCAPPVESIIGSVSEILLGKTSPKQELENLARVHGTDTVVCAVERLRSDWRTPGASASPERADALGRADAWLLEVHTKGELAPQ
jgi:hypothetical protein